MWKVAQKNTGGQVSKIYLFWKIMLLLLYLIHIDFFQHEMNLLETWQNSCHYVTYYSMLCPQQLIFVIWCLISWLFMLCMKRALKHYSYSACVPQYLQQQSLKYCHYTGILRQNRVVGKNLLSLGYILPNQVFFGGMHVYLYLYNWPMSKERSEICVFCVWYMGFCRLLLCYYYS